MEKYKDTWKEGKYVCAKCSHPLFRSDDKFDSGTSWPSFRKSMPKSVATQDDFSLGMRRTELLCSKCKHHLGHVFDDGKTCGDKHPEAGMRYCILSDALKFKEKEK